MIRELKTLGLTLLAVLAFGAIAASAAQAAPTFTAESYPATMDSEVTVANTFTSQGRVVKCTTTTFSAELTAASTTLTVTPTYSNCTATVLGKTFPATVTLNGCDFLLHLTAETGPSPYLATADVVCSGSNDIVIHLYETTARHTANEPTCTFTLKAQTGLEQADISNGTNVKTGRSDMTVKSTFEKISNVVFGNETTCGMTNTKAKYEGSITLNGTFLQCIAEPQGISVSG